MDREKFDRIVEYMKSAITLYLEAIRSGLPPSWTNNPHLSTADEYRLMAINTYGLLGAGDKALFDNRYRRTRALMYLPLNQWRMGDVEQVEREMSPKIMLLGVGVRGRLRHILAHRDAQ